MLHSARRRVWSNAAAVEKALRSASRARPDHRTG